MTRKFLFCFPLRLGNVIFGYIVLIISIAVVAYHLYELGLSLVDLQKDETEQKQNEKFRNWQRIESLLEAVAASLVPVIGVIYHASYIIIGFLLFVFAAIFTCGAYKANECFVSTFFVYCFVHLFLTIGLVVWEATTESWVELGLIILSDLLLIICLFSVKYLIEAIRTGHIYSRPGEVYYKH